MELHRNSPTYILDRFYIALYFCKLKWHWTNDKYRNIYVKLLGWCKSSYSQPNKLAKVTAEVNSVSTDWWWKCVPLSVIKFAYFHFCHSMYFTSALDILTDFELITKRWAYYSSANFKNNNYKYHIFYRIRKTIFNAWD